MFKLMEDEKGNPILKWIDRYPTSRGIWVEIGRKDERGMDRIIRMNQANGLHVFLDEKGVYRAFVLSD